MYLVWLIAAALHMGFCLSWCESNKRSGFETIAFVSFVAVAWPLFVVRMLFRGYVDFLVGEWPDRFWS